MAEERQDQPEEPEGLQPENTCFVVAPIGEEGSPVRIRSDKVLRHIIEPVASESGLQALRADQIHEPGVITADLIQHVLHDRLVIADLTGSNPNVFYELALRHTLRSAYVQIIEKGEKIPFDIAAARTIQVDHTDLDSVEECKAKMKVYIGAALTGDEEVESPISVSVQLDQLRGRGDPEQLELAEILSAVQEIRSEIADVASDVHRTGARLRDFAERPTGALPVEAVSMLYDNLEILAEYVEQPSLFEERDRTDIMGRVRDTQYILGRVLGADYAPYIRSRTSRTRPVPGRPQTARE